MPSTSLALSAGLGTVSPCLVVFGSICPSRYFSHSAAVFSVHRMLTAPGWPVEFFPSVLMISLLPLLLVSNQLPATAAVGKRIGTSCSAASASSVTVRQPTTPTARTNTLPSLLASKRGHPVASALL